MRRFGQDAQLENRRAILGLLERNEPVKVLDVGCGDGSFTKEMGERIGTTELHGVEIERELAELCAANGVRVHRTDLNETLPLDNESFDVVIANQVLEHVWRTDAFVRELHRIVQRGGYAIISTPNLATWHNVLCIVLGYQPFATGVSDEVNLGNPLSPDYRRKTWGGLYDAHLRVFTYRALKELFQYHGFTVETILGVGYYSLPTQVSGFLSRVDPRHSLFVTMKARRT